MPEQDLLQKIAELEAIINSFKERERKKAKQEYEKVRRNVQDALFNSQKIESRFEKIAEKLELTNFLLLLGSANNPSNSNLGFNLFDTVKKIAEDILASGLSDGDKDKPKTRFLDIVSKVINNPIADVLLKSNPVGAVIGNVMNVASNFINTTAEGGVLKKAYTITKDVIVQEKLDEFSDALKKYESYYSQLLSTTNGFRNRLDFIESKNLNLKVSLRNYHERYLGTLGINPETEIIDQFNEVFKLTEVNGELNYLDVLGKQEIIDTIEIVEKMPAFESQVDTFVQEFEDSFAQFVNEYIKVLKIALTWSDDEIDKDKLNSFITKVEVYLNNNFKVVERVNPSTNEVIAFSVISPSLIASIA